MSQRESLEVRMDDRLVGTLALRIIRWHFLIVKNGWSMDFQSVHFRFR